MRSNAGLAGIMFVAFAIFIALFAGLLSSILPWWFALLLFSPPLIVGIGGRWPVAGLLVVTLFVFGIIPFGGAIFADKVVVGFLLMMAVTRWRLLQPAWERLREHWLNYLMLMLWMSLNAAYALIYLKTPTVNVYQEYMSMAYWAVMAGTALIAYDDKRARQTLYLLIGLATLLSLQSVLQSVLGMRLSFSGTSRVEMLDASVGGVAGLARSGVPGLLLVVFTMFMAIANLLRGTGRRWVWSIVLAITAGAIFVSFGRALWSTVLLGIAVTTLMSGRSATIKMGTYGVMVVLLVVVVVSIVKPEILSGMAERMLSLKQEGGSQTSLGWRLTENHFAFGHILNHPLIGIGLGAEYKPRLIDIRIFAAQTFYIHNGYLYVLMKTGLIGLVLYGIFVGNIMRATYREYKTPLLRTSQHIAFFATLIVTLILNFTQPELITGSSVMCLAMLAPVTLALNKLPKAVTTAARRFHPATAAA